MELLETFFTFWSAIIIALLTLLGIDVMQYLDAGSTVEQNVTLSA